MKQTKKLLSLFLSLCMLLSITAGLDFSSYANTSGDWEYKVLDDGTATITKYNGQSEKISIPTKLNSYVITEIEGFAFSDSTKLKSVIIPDTVKIIGWYAFGGCERLSSVKFGKNVVEISGSAFAGCTKLGSITIPEKVKLVDKWAFASCTSLENINVSSNNKYYTSINGVLFNKSKTKLIQYPIGNNRKSYVIPNGVVSIYDEAFSQCKKINSVDIPISVKEINIFAFSECKNLKDVYYSGSKESWSKIAISEENECLTKCKFHYNKLRNESIVLSSASYTYNGKVKKPSVTVKDSKGKKIASSNYTVSYSSGRKNVGKYTVTIKFKGNYSGTIKKTFTIKPKSTTISKLTAGKKAFTVKWKKQATQSTGYQIQYATDSKFTKNKKTVTISKNKTTSKKITKLKAKKKYYVRVRTYKTVKVNGKNTKVYSSWSKAKTVKTK